MTPSQAIAAVEIAVGFKIGNPTCVLITARIGKAVKTVEVDPEKFLAGSGLGMYFYQLKPDFARIVKNDRRAQRAAKKKAGRA